MSLAHSQAESLLREIPVDDFYMLGLSGAPGTGKTTLANTLKARLDTRGDVALVLSLDDYYLDQQQRKDLANIHPLFAQRGVPGTHDWDRLIGDLDKLADGEIGALRLPRFDKLQDDRQTVDLMLPMSDAPRVVILEGWLIGAPPQDFAALADPVNELEAVNDPDCRWRAAVNEWLARYHQDLGDRLDARWFMNAPSWDKVIDWRWQQEREAIRSGSPPHLESREAVAHFLGQYQRIASHMLETCDEWADVIIWIDQDHHLSMTKD